MGNNSTGNQVARGSKSSPVQSLAHFGAEGQAIMVDVGAKPVTHRVAVAVAEVTMQSETLARIRAGSVGKGDVLGVARLAGIMASKRTAELIPLCHPLAMHAVEIDFELGRTPLSHVKIRARVEGSDRTGFEMEALTAASVAALTIYDMCKSADRGMAFSVHLAEKSGGKSGHWKK